MTEKILQAANAGLNRDELVDFYPLKEKILRQYGRMDGYDWQYVEKICFACNGTGEGDPSDYYEQEDYCEHCGGDGYWKRFWTKLERHRIGDIIFHTPVQKFYAKPDEPHDITINGYVQHAPASHRKAQWSFFLLAVIFDTSILFDMTMKYFKFKYAATKRRTFAVKRESILDDLPF